KGELRVKNFTGFGVAFLFGFFLYAMLEIAFRGYTHWTMCLTGGIALMVLYDMELRLNAHYLWRAFLGAVFITAFEFAVGVADNLLMGWRVWDYSDLPMNILGQICLPFSALWFVLSLIAGIFCRRIWQCLAYRSEAQSE
ncbi:MAG: hypothetical protein ACI4J3_02265, partial [Oscillospiraceae bacterium]